MTLFMDNFLVHLGTLGVDGDCCAGVKIGSIFVMLGIVCDDARLADDGTLIESNHRRD